MHVPITRPTKALLFILLSFFWSCCLLCKPSSWPPHWSFWRPSDLCLCLQPLAKASPGLLHTWPLRGENIKSTITGVMSKFNTCASAHLGSRRGPYISSDTPGVFAESSQSELNCQGRYHWSEREREREMVSGGGLGECSKASCLHVAIQKQRAGGCHTVQPLHSILKAPHCEEFYLTRFSDIICL